MFLSRSHLPDGDLAQARDLCRSVEDWALLTDIAARKFSLPFVYRNLQRVALGPDDTQILQAMHQATLEITLAAMRVVTAQKTFHNTCIAPRSLTHVYLKGPTLAARYYDDPSLRYARDIDVLVSRRDQEPIARRAMAHGYRLFDH